MDEKVDSRTLSVAYIFRPGVIAAHLPKFCLARCDGSKKFRVWKPNGNIESSLDGDLHQRSALEAWLTFRFE
jgi:hypothetical protein